VTGSEPRAGRGRGALLPRSICAERPRPSRGKAPTSRACLGERKFLQESLRTSRGKALSKNASAAITGIRFPETAGRLSYSRAVL
jgi:hypothetical protein